MGYHREKRVKGLSVEVVNDNVDRALRKFKKKVMDSGLLKNLKDREFYEKPTTARKKARGAARSRWLKKLADQALPKKLY